VIAPQYEEAEPFAQGLGAVKQGDKWGFIDTKGNLVVALQFAHTRSFSEGLARVMNREPGANRLRIGFIDRTGKLVIPCGFSSGGDFAEERAWVEVNGNGHFIDPKGKVIYTFGPNFYPYKFEGGLAPVESRGEWGYVDKTGEIVIEPRFDQAGSFSGPTAVVRLGDRYGLIDRTGKLVKEMKPNAVLGDTIESLTQFTPDGEKWGFVDSHGKIVIAPRFVLPPEEGVEPPRFSEGRAAVYVQGKYGFIDRRGKRVIAATFDEAGSFSEGLAPVASGYRRVLIDKTGKVLKQLPPADPGAEVRIEKIEISP
jgi:hypothetical protein